jgi:hypothetical protein
MHEETALADELDKIKAMLSFMADSTDLLLMSSMQERQQPLSDTPYGMHLFFMELISRIERTSDRAGRAGNDNQAAKR